MFVLSMRFSPKKAAVLCCAAVVCAAAFWGAGRLKAANEPAVENVASVRQVKAKVKDNRQRVDFLTGFGWQLVEEPEEITDILLPEAMDDVWSSTTKFSSYKGTIWKNT